nr:sporulation protein YunB [bacterium]
MAVYRLLAPGEKQQLPQAPLLKSNQKKRCPAAPAGLKAAAVATIAVGLLSVILLAKIKPVLLAAGEVRVRAIGITAMNEAVQALMLDRADGWQLVNLIRDETGSVVALQADPVRLTQVSTQVIQITQDKLNGLKRQSIGIPIGALFGPGSVWASFGPKVSLHVMPAGNVTAEFYTQFEQAGINQTLHRVFLRLHTSIAILVPTGSKSIDIDSEIPISETILIGDVPEYYLHAQERNLMDLVPKVQAAP